MYTDMAVRQLSNKGLKRTPQRKLLLDILLHETGHLSAEEIFSKIKESQPNVSFGTVYRNLSLLADLGIINQLDFKDGRSRFEISSDHHHHLVCLGCGTAIDMPMCPFSQLIHETADANNFSIEHHNFEVFGYCEGCTKTSECRNNKTKSESHRKQGAKP